MEQEVKILLFGPKSEKSLKKLHPELAREKEFKDLHPDDLLFSWYVGNPSSPIDPDWDDYTRFSSAAQACFTKPDQKDKKKLYAAGKFNEEVKIAIEKMKKYSPDARMLSKRMVQAMFHNFQKMVDVDSKEFKTTDKDGKEGTDWTAKKQYIDSCTKISEALPGIIRQIEEGFGIEETKKNGDTVRVKAIDKFHQDQ